MGNPFCSCKLTSGALQHVWFIFVKNMTTNEMINHAKCARNQREMACRGSV